MLLARNGARQPSRVLLIDLDLIQAPTAIIDPEDGIIVSVHKVKSRFSAVMDEDDQVGLELFTLSIDVRPV